MRDARTFLAVCGVVALVAAGALVATLAGGGSGGDGSANGSVPVERVDQLTGSWLAVNDASAPATTLGTVRLDFSADAQLVAQTGCNGLFGPVSVEDSVLVAGDLISSLMGCQPALTAQERWVTEMIEGRPRLELSGPYLYLHWGEGEQWWLGLEREPEGTHASIPAS
jgi:heat shock protein HslJ